MTAETIEDITLLDSLPPEWPEELLTHIREEIDSSRYKIVILDDDPTGTQTVRDLPVLTHWSVAALQEELLQNYPAFFILTNSRSLPERAACALAREVGENLAEASALTGIRVIPISRSDSTLRGHFPAEVDAMSQAMNKDELPYLIIPFFYEGGRYTVNDIHYVQEGDYFVPAASTPFAKDSAFGFSRSNLKDWVEEKTAGRIKADTVHSLSISDIRSGGPEKVSEILDSIPPRSACIVNLASYSDMEVFVTALLEVEKSGKEFLYRTAASFVRTRTGQDHKIKLVGRQELLSGSSHGGLFVIGSYVEKTSSQLKALLSKTDIEGIEVQVEPLLDEDQKTEEILRVVRLATENLLQQKDCAIYTSRTLVTGTDAASSLNIGQTISDSLIEIVKSITLQPRYLVAKGGITSSDVATKALGIKRAMVIGQPLPGVPAWKLGPEARYPDMSYIVFPGNVGDDMALVELKNSLQKTDKEKL